MIPLIERINLELRHRNPSEVTDLILDTSKSDKIEGLTDEYVSLRELSLVNVGLKSLSGFPKLPNLEKLDLSDNRISGGLENLQNCPKLCQLFLTSNRFRNIEDLQPLRDMPALEVIDLCHCAITETENYRDRVFQLLPQLVYLDGYDKNDAESDYEEYDDDYADDHTDDFSHVSRAKYSHAPGKNGKIKSLLNYEEEANNDEHLALNVFYCGNDEDCVEDDQNQPLFEIFNTNYVDDDESDDSDGSDGSSSSEGVLDDGPPQHGSKFAPSNQPRTATKRSLCADDCRDATAQKVRLRDLIGSAVPD